MRKLELRKETKKHLMEEGRHTEKQKGHHTTNDPAAKEKDIVEEAIDRRRRIQKQGETEHATGVRKNGQGRERENPNRKRIRREQQRNRERKGRGDRRLEQRKDSKEESEEGWKPHKRGGTRNAQENQPRT